MPDDGSFDSSASSVPHRSHDLKREDVAKPGGGMGAALASLFDCLTSQWTVVEKLKTDPDTWGEKKIFALIRQRAAGQQIPTASKKFSTGKFVKSCCGNPLSYARCVCRSFFG